MRSPSLTGKSHSLETGVAVPVPSIPGQIIGLVVCSGIGVVLCFYPELFQRIIIKILDFEGVAPDSWRRKLINEESYPFKLFLYGVGCFAMAAAIVLLIIKNDF